MKKAIFGLLAHVDAGKTTLSEALLYRSGALRKLGRVDHQDSFLDQESQERERGITIFSKQARFQLPDLEVTLLDTPGHVDFSSETERTLQVLDYCILVISGSDGVQSHTKTLWRLLERYQVPTFLFINKMDLHQKEKEELLKELQETLSGGCLDMTSNPELLQENIAALDERAMEEFFAEGEITDRTVRKLIRRRLLFPCYFGSALKLEGIDALLEALNHWTEPPAYDKDFSAKVYKIGHDPQGERLTFLKVTGGQIRVKDLLHGQAEGEPWAEKVNQIRLYSGARYQTAEVASAGDVCAITGLTKTYVGEGLGAETDSQKPLLDSFLTYEVLLQEGKDIHTLHKELQLLEEEDPQLHVLWNPEKETLNLQLMGEVQLEVLQRLIYDRFQETVTFGPGSIVYLETIAAPVEGVGHYEPLRHYAEVHLLLEPAERGKGLIFRSALREDYLDKPYQHLILTHLAEKTHVGVLTGSAITDMTITLVGGAASVDHTVGGDFRESTYRAVRQGLMKARSILLEPWYDFELSVPMTFVGRALTDLERMGARFESPVSIGNSSVITGSVAVEAIQGYAITLSSFTRGEGSLTLVPKGYEPCRHQEAVVESFHYDPESDMENPAGSIFCAHGAGFFVPWQEVPRYMHLTTAYSEPAVRQSPHGGNGSIESSVQGYRNGTAFFENNSFTGPYAPDGSHILEESSSDKEHDRAQETKTKKSSVRSGGSLEQDKELMAIFERTYGKIKEEAFHPVKKQSKKTPEMTEVDSQRRKKTPANQEPVKEYLLVDGYNLLYALEELKDISHSNLDLARSRLMDLMSAYQSIRGGEVILVFDAYNVEREKEDVIKYHNIYVVYTKQAETADTYIAKTTQELSPKHHVRVATSDNAEQLIVLGHGALRISSREFEQELNQVREELDRILEAWNKQEKTALTQKMDIL